MRFDTKILHNTTSKGYKDREILPPISQVSAFQYESMEDLEKVFAHKSMGYAYTRIGNPTISALEKKVSELEGGIGAICCSSGMAAITSSLLAICEKGDEIIAGQGLYGGTIGLFHDLEKIGIHTVFADMSSVNDVKSKINDRTRVIFGEVIANPALTVMDIDGLSKVAHERNIPLIVDSTTATPYLIKSLEHGADIVIHSSSKYLNGGGNSIGGIIVDSGRFSWDFSKHTALKEYAKYSKMAFSVRLRTDIWENIGACMSPFNAYLTYIGIDTLAIRMERICSNANKLAKALDDIEDIDVNYLTLDTHSSHTLATQILSGQGGGILSFRVGSKDRAFRIINALKLAFIATNIGDVRTLVVHPASTLYINSSREEMENAGVFEDTIRVSVGIEDANDLIDDFINAISNN